jgi:DNA repair protein SbcD/Mre11
VDVRAVPVPQPRPMARIAGSFDEILTSRRFEPDEDSWVQITVTDPGRPQQMRERAARRFPHILEVRHVPGDDASGLTDSLVNPRTIDPLDVARDFVHHVTGEAISDAELACFQEAHDAVLAAERSG